MLDKLTVDDFKPAVGQPFQLSAEGAEPIEAELVDARTHEAEAPATADDGTRTPFTLTFRGPVEPVLPQQIYRVEHDSVGPLEIFLVPIGADQGGARYEAIFA